MAEPRRRNLPGTPQGEIFKWKSSDFKADGHYSVQEWIQDKIRSDPTDIKAICKPPEHVHKHEWIYEHIRQIIIELNALVVSLQASCTGSSCPKMTAGEGFEFLSACYGAQPQMVSAVDYACHNIDFHVAIINKTKNFPRPNHDALGKKAMKELSDVAKRLYRIIAHAYFHHKEEFMGFEFATGLYKRFAHLNETYKLTSFTPAIKVN